MELEIVMRTTGAVREFRDEPVPDGVLARIFDLARFAPSGGNRQGWHVVLARDPGLRRRIAELTREGHREYSAYVAAGRVPFAPGDDGRWHGTPPDVDPSSFEARSAFVEGLLGAPVLAVLVADLRALAVVDVDLDRQSIVGGASIYPFAQNVLLAARDAGVGGVMTTFLCRREPEVKELLGLDPHHAVAALIVLGYPVSMPSRLRRREVAEFVRIDTLDGAPLEA